MKKKLSKWKKFLLLGEIVKKKKKRIEDQISKEKKIGMEGLQKDHFKKGQTLHNDMKTVCRVIQGKQCRNYV